LRNQYRSKMRKDLPLLRYRYREERNVKRRRKITLLRRILEKASVLKKRVPYRKKQSLFSRTWPERLMSSEWRDRRDLWRWSMDIFLLSASPQKSASQTNFRSRAQGKSSRVLAGTSEAQRGRWGLTTVAGKIYGRNRGVRERNCWRRAGRMVTKIWRDEWCHRCGLGVARGWGWEKGEGSMDRRVSSRTWGRGASRNLGGIFPVSLPLFACIVNFFSA